jgi:hypothetical protein
MRIPISEPDLDYSKPAPSPSDIKTRTRITVLVLGLLAVALYGPLIGWGLPYATAPDRTKTVATDEILPLEGLAEMHNTFVVSKPDRNYGYPWWHYFVVSVAQAPYLAYLMVTGGMQSPSPVFPFGLKDPVRALQTLTLIGRSVSVLMAAGVVIAAYFFSRTLWGHLAGLIAALLTMLNYLMFYYSRTGNPDVPVFFWSSIGLVVFAKILVRGLTIRRAVWLGIFAGLATATKDQAVILFLPLGLVLLFPRFSRSPESSNYVKPLIVGLGVSIVAYLIGTGMVVDPQRHITHVYSLFFNQSRVSNVGAYRPPHPKTWLGIWELTRDYIQAFAAMVSLPVLLASLAGVVLVWRSAQRRFLVLFLPVAVLYLMLILPTGQVVMRYYLPLTLFIDSFAAAFVVALRGSPFRRLWVLLLVVLCGWRLLIGADLSFAQYYDTRYPASEWLKTYARAGDWVEYFGVTEKLPHLSAEIKTRRIAGRTTNWKRQFDHGPMMLHYLATKGPEWVLVIPDVYSKPGIDYSGDCPPEVYEALINGTAGYSQVAFFPTPSLLFGRLRRPLLDNPSVAPPVRIFARDDILNRIGHEPTISQP